MMTKIKYTEGKKNDCLQDKNSFFLSKQFKENVASVSTSGKLPEIREEDVNRRERSRFPFYGIATAWGAWHFLPREKFVNED
jgi:hypothetical protein